MASETILVIEDERDIVEVIAYNLERDGFRVLSAQSGEDGLATAQGKLPDLIVLDVMLPGMNGFDVCRALRGEPATRKIPIVMLTARDDDIDVVTGLELGADDYLTKPFSPKVLIARIRAVLRRVEEATAAGSKSDPIKVGDLKIDRTRHSVTVGGEDADLTRTEFDLLVVLAERPGWVFSRSQLIDYLRDGQQVITDRAIDVQVANLRKKLGSHGSYVETVRGVGYRLTEKE